MTGKAKHNKRGTNRVWIVPVVLIVILALSVGGYYSYSLYGQYQDNIESSRQSASEQAELDGMRQVLDRNTFYNGISIDDLDLSGKTFDEVNAELAKRDQAWRSQFGATLKLDEQTLQLTAADSGLTSDWQTILNQAWQIGRTSPETGESARIRDRYAVVAALLTTPKHLTISRNFSPAAVRSAILAIAGSLKIEPVNASATGFDLTAKAFVCTGSIPGRLVDGEPAATEVLKRLAAGQYGQTVVMTAQTILPEIDTTLMQAKLGLVSEAVTKAVAINTPRDYNIKLICKMLNGLLLQPGESFSFNGFIGERTAAKGFKEAGGIKGGILIQELGGGICQPNTTLCQAVLKADLQIDERYPHSWPSTYTDIGLDATVSWQGPDFKFTNNTDYPIAVVSWYTKPSVVVQIYGRKLEEGVSIALHADVTSTTPVTSPPTEIFNPLLAPGARVELRGAYKGHTAEAYKIWMKDGQVIKKEFAFKSTYKVLNAIYEYGPPLIVTPAPTPMPPIDPATTPEPTPTTAG